MQWIDSYQRFKQSEWSGTPFLSNSERHFLPRCEFDAALFRLPAGGRQRRMASVRTRKGSKATTHSARRTRDQ